MANEYMSPRELRYYRNMIALEVDDEVEWRIRPTSATSPLMRGVITAMYPDGKDPYFGIANAFMMVRGHLGRRYSVLYTNPTLKKLETDK